MTMTNNDDRYFVASDYRDIDLTEWSKYSNDFMPSELASKGDGSIKIRKDVLKALQAVRTTYGKPLVINSGYRDTTHNKKVGGSAVSQHLNGIAFDIKINNFEMGRQLEQIAKDLNFTAFGRYDTFIHIDMRPSKVKGKNYYWGKKYELR